ncbi:MAG: LamG domain-containing protein, partial [Tannerella sp.]|nr:LamG domain-containing protein [Tannerella sp.]
DGDYYRFDYNTTIATVQPFIDKLADGHSFECLVKFDFNYTASAPTYETKFFSTQGSGGTGFLVTNASQATGGNALAFIPNVGGWKWANSQLKPDGATYYHLVGVWDKTAGKAYIYIDGVLKGTADAAGTYTPAAATSRWICIGGDAGGMNAEGCFKGNLVIARVYDRALTATEVTALWNQAKP